MIRAPKRIEARDFETSESLFCRLCVDSIGDLHESNTPLRNEERAQRAAKVGYQGTHHVSHPLGRGHEVAEGLSERCKRADLEQPIKLPYRGRRLRTGEELIGMARVDTDLNS